MLNISILLKNVNGIALFCAIIYPMAKYHFLYKTTNLVNGKIYIGVHSTDNLQDGYLGSGKYLLRAVRKHGSENFRREIVEFFNHATEMYQREKEIVTEEFVRCDDNYNFATGGLGGLKAKRVWTEEQKIALSKKHKGKSYHLGVSGAKNPRFGKPGTFLGQKHGAETLAKMSAAWTDSRRQNVKRGKARHRYGIPAGNKGKSPSLETRLKQSKNHADFNGSKNPNARPITVDGVDYACMKDACKALNISIDILRTRLKSQ